MYQRMLLVLNGCDLLSDELKQASYRLVGELLNAWRMIVGHMRHKGDSFSHHDVDSLIIVAVEDD